MEPESIDTNVVCNDSEECLAVIIWSMVWPVVNSKLKWISLCTHSWSQFDPVANNINERRCSAAPRLWVIFIQLQAGIQPRGVLLKPTQARTIGNLVKVGS